MTLETVQEIVSELRDADHECTSCPYWLIIDPKQMMSPDPHQVASMITGPFFSRESAESFLKHNDHRFSKKATVCCRTGIYSRLYEKFYREATK